MKKILYIAYGSNIDKERMAKMCPNAKFIGTSVIKDYQLLFKGNQISGLCDIRYVFATIEPKSGGVVPVVVWEIDKYEEYPELYYKTNINISVFDKEKQGMIYVMKDDKKAKPAKKVLSNYTRCLQFAWI